MSTPGNRVLLAEFGLEPSAAVAGRPCRSNVHPDPVTAVCVGTFDFPDGPNPPEPDSPYCLRCAVMLADIGWFTPTDGTDLPDTDDYLRARGDHPHPPHT